MNENRKSGYVAGGIFLLVGILITVVGFDSGWNSGKITIIVGVFFTLLGIGGIWKPDIIGQPLAHYLKQVAENQKSESISQNQKKTKNSTQAIAKDHSNVTVQNNYYKSDLPEEKTSDEKKELIKEIGQELTKEKLSNTLIKCIRLANLINSKKDVFWLENEAQGFDERTRGKIKDEEIPDYRIINTEIRLASTADIGYTPLNYKLTLGSPIFQIEEWIESYNKTTSPGEMILTAPMTEAFKKIYRESFQKNPPSEKIPYIISISELKKILNGVKLRINTFISSIK